MTQPNAVAERVMRRLLDMDGAEWDARWPRYWATIRHSELPEALNLQRTYAEVERAIEEDRRGRLRVA